MAEEHIELDVLGALAGSDGDPPEWPAVEVSGGESDNGAGGDHRRLLDKVLAHAVLAGESVRWRRVR